MLRIGLALLLILSSIGLTATAALADCVNCVDNVSLQTRDGLAWTAGKPVTLVVHVTRQAAGSVPPSAVAVVMQTDGDRTKCLGVPLKLVQSDASGGVYAGLFFPFHQARYDGVLVVGSDVERTGFDVSQMAPGMAPAGELPAAEPLDTSAARAIPFIDWPVPTVVGVLAMGAVLALVATSRWRPTRQSLVS